MITAPRFTLADLEAANDSWGCNCGPGALAAICGRTLDEARQHLGPRWPGYTNPTAMRDALLSLHRSGHVVAIAYLRANAEGVLPWPRWGLCRIQWEGPWTRSGVPMSARYRYTHWVGAATDRRRGTGIFDVNVLANGSGWCSLDDWSSKVAPVLAVDHDKRATGGWHITHSIEVTR